ncbi:MAG: YdcF family protein [Nitrospinota bacterium]|nr:YdcF family protein [Nitrospinota bacterium]
MDTQISLRSGNRRPGFGARLKSVLVITGALALLFVLSAFTGAYKPVERWLSSSEYSSTCDYIVLLPAGPVPNSATLARAYKTAEEYARNPTAKVIVSHKMEKRYIGSTLWTIKVELMLRGVPREAIILEKKARSTNEHAKYLKESKFGDYQKNSYLLVTSPTHIMRSVMAFRTAGFKRVYGASATAESGWEDMGQGLFLRYQAWDRLVDQILVIRELMAIAFYKLRGWA